MYNLAFHPEYVEPLRKEIETIVANEGWAESSVMKMHKLDSFLKESMRLYPLGQGKKSVLFGVHSSRHRESSNEAVHIFKRNYSS